MAYLPIRRLENDENNKDHGTFNDPCFGDFHLDYGKTCTQPRKEVLSP
jgi:hypothetical protein